MNNYEEAAKVFKAFCDPHRIEILNILTKGEHCACKLLEILDVSQSTLSHHMKILVDAQVVLVRKDGKWSHYSLNDKGLDKAIQYLNQMKS